MEADFVEFATANLSRVTEDELGSEDLVDEVFTDVFDQLQLTAMFFTFLFQTMYHILLLPKKKCWNVLMFIITHQPKNVNLVKLNTICTK